MASGTDVVGRWDGRLDVGAAVLGLVGAVVMLPLQLLASQVLLAALPLVLGIASAAYLISVRHVQTRVRSPRRVGAPIARVLRAGTIVGLSGLVLLAVATSSRGLPFAVGATVVGALLFVQILLVEDDALDPGWLLAEILAFALVLRFAAIWTTPGFVGVDAWRHVTTYADAIRSANSLSAIEDVKYYGAPFYHLFVVVAADAFGTSLRTALFLSVGIVVPIATLLVYHAARFLLPVRWSLLAMAVFAVGDQAIRWGIHLIPTSLGLVFFLAILYAVTRLFYADDRRATYLLALFFGVAVVLTHQISVFITLAFLGAGILAHAIARYSDRRSSTGTSDRYGGTVNLTGLFAGVGAITLLNWSVTPYQSGSFLSTMTSVARESIASSAGFLQLAGPSGQPAASHAIITTVPDWVVVVDSLGFFLLLGSFVLGSLVVLRAEWRAQLTLTYVLAGGSMLVVVFGLPLFGLTFLLPGRWYAFLYAPMAIVGVVGIVHLYAQLPPGVVLVGALLLAIALPGAMLIAHGAAPENPTFQDSYPRYAYTDSELDAVETISERRGADAPPVHTDHPYRTVFERWKGVPVEALRLRADGTIAGDAAVYRRYQSHGAARVSDGEHLVGVHVDSQRVCGPERAVLYQNDAVQYCRSPSN